MKTANASTARKNNIVIVGRPNVGKSSLFNRLLGRKRALVLDTPGVTRDRIIEPAVFWVRAEKYPVNLIDTGGLGEGQFKQEIAMQVETALADAALILFVMDIKAGLTNSDEMVFQELRRAGLTESIPVVGVLNKADADEMDVDAPEFYKLGMDRVMAISAEHNLGIDELKEVAVELMELSPEPQPRDEDALEIAEDLDEESENSGDHPEEQADAEEVIFAEQDEDVTVLESEEALPADKPISRIPSIAIVGQPNVGKSTLLNAICGEKRSIVSPIAGTTVDAIDTQIQWRGKDFLFIDTAGIRRKNKTEQGIEVLSVVQSRKTLERADLAILVMDGEKGVYDQDEKIAGLIEQAGCSVILVLNKWDTQKNNDDFSQKLAEEEIRKKLRFLGYAPLVFTTAKDGLGLERLYRMIESVLEQRWLKLSTKELTEFIREEAGVHNPGNAKFYFVHQSGRNPPTFVAHVSDPRKIHFSLSRHLVRAIRDRWGYSGTPIRFHFLKTKNTGER
jgi:GTP-binding protein